MTIRIFLIGTIVSTLASWVLWFLIINWLDPKEAGAMGYALFFLTFFLAIASASALFGYAIRRFLFARELPAYSVRPSLRQGIWLGLFVNLLLFLQLLRLMRWWIAFIIVLLFLSLEVLFLSYDRNGRQRGESGQEG